MWQIVSWIWQEVPVPVIAGIHGVAYGGGCQIALGADVRFVAPDARLSVMEIKWGLIPDMAITATLRHVGRLDVAKELTFTGRIVSGTEAVDNNTLTNLAGGTTDADFATILAAAAGVEYHLILPCFSNADAVASGGAAGPDDVITHINLYNSGLDAKLQQLIYGSSTTLSAAKTGADEPLAVTDKDPPGRRAGSNGAAKENEAARRKRRAKRR